MKATHWFFWLFAGLFLSSPALANAHGIQRRIVELHPTPENIPEVTDPTFILHEDPELAFMSEASHEKIVIGVADGEYHEMFGIVTDLAFPGDGTVLVLDYGSSEVRVFDYGGALLSSFGRPGEGPGEFRNRPFKISVADQGQTVFVLEEYGRSVVAFDRQDDSTYIPKAHFRTGLLAHDGCAMNGHFWVYGIDPDYEGVLHKFTYDGKRVASFLEYYQSPREKMSRHMSRMGLLACSEAHGIVVLNRVWAPVVTGYRENGEVAWHVKFASFDPTYFAEYEGGDWGFNPLKPGQRRLETIFTDPAGNLYVQYVTREGRDIIDRSPYSGPLFKIDVRTGLGMYLGSAPSVEGIDSGYGFSVTNNPFPQVVIHKPKAGG